LAKALALPKPSTASPTHLISNMLLLAAAWRNKGTMYGSCHAPCAPAAAAAAVAAVLKMLMPTGKPFY
jgi:hypothetical protein